jgi:hypothetical protein
MSIRAWHAGSLREGAGVIVYLGLFIALGVGPFVLYMLFIRTGFASALTGAALLFSTGVVLVIVFGTSDPMAGLAFISVIPINYAIFIAGIVLENRTLRRSAPRG